MEKTWTREELEAAYSDTRHRAWAAADEAAPPPWENVADWHDYSEDYQRRTYFSWNYAQTRIQNLIFGEFYASEVGQALELAEARPEWRAGTLDKIQVPT